VAEPAYSAFGSRLVSGLTLHADGLEKSEVGGALGWLWHPEPGGEDG
jgi:hypothetical protein